MECGLCAEGLRLRVWGLGIGFWGWIRDWVLDFGGGLGITDWVDGLWMRDWVYGVYGLGTRDWVYGS